METTAPTSLTLVADILDMPFAELAALNPASLRGMVPENFSLHVPKGSGNPLVAALQMIPSNHLDAWRMHRVGSGETLATIGKRYGVTPANIVSVNRLESAQAVEGDRLLIPSVQRVQAPVAKEDDYRHGPPQGHDPPEGDHHRLGPPRPQESRGAGAQRHQLVSDPQSEPRP